MLDAIKVHDADHGIRPRRPLPGIVSRAVRRVEPDRFEPGMALGTNTILLGKLTFEAEIPGALPECGPHDSRPHVAPADTAGFVLSGNLVVEEVLRDDDFAPVVAAFASLFLTGAGALMVRACCSACEATAKVCVGAGLSKPSQR